MVGEAPLTSLFSAETIAQLRLSQTNANAQAYIDNNNPFVIRQFRDAPGGYIRGIELNYQQNLTFLPWYFQNLGIQANYTHLESELNYILTPQPLVTGVGPFTGASPDAALGREVRLRGRALRIIGVRSAREGEQGGTAYVPLEAQHDAFLPTPRPRAPD